MHALLAHGVLRSSNEIRRAHKADKAMCAAYSGQQRILMQSYNASRVLQHAHLKAKAYLSHATRLRVLCSVQVDALIDEFFNSGDIQEASTTLQELDEPEYGHFFVKRAVTRALDKHNHEREMSSILLSALYGEVSL